MSGLTQSATIGMALILSLSTAQAETRHHDAHIHGQGSLNIAIEDQTLYMEMDIPAHDILGYESVTTDSQKAELKQALNQLESASLWILPEAAACTLVNAKSHTDQPERKEHKEHQHRENTEHQHEHKHHSHHHDEHDSNNSGHMNFTATYTYQCNNTQAISHLKTRLFDQFKHSEKLSLQALTAKGAQSGELTRNTPEAAL